LTATGIHAQTVSDLLGNLDVIAVGIAPVDVLDGNGGVGLLGRLPVVGSVGSLHANSKGGPITEHGRG